MHSAKRLRPRARLMQHLGADLIPSDRVAITELVKNSYDADASLVVLRFVGPDQGEDGPAIEVWDDGHGMNEAAVESIWLEIANPNRLRNPYSESGNRRVLGAKGLGRFAVARLGATMLLVSRRLDEPEVTLLMDWRDFDKPDAYLEDVPVDWQAGEPEYFAPGGPAHRVFAPALARLREAEQLPAHADLGSHGTVLRLENLHANWTPDMVDELRTSLSRLVPPTPPRELDVPPVSEFAIFVDASGVDGADSSLVAPSPTLEKPRYRLVGTVESDGNASLTFTSRLSPAAESIETMLRPEGAPSCGPIQIDIRVWDLDAEGLRDLTKLEVGATTTHEVRRLIRSNSGIAVYRDGFRVQPYGDPEVDWLKLDIRRVNNPTLRLSNNQVAAFVYISADSNPELRDQANRVGLIENREYAALRDTLQAAIALLEERRYRLRRDPKEPQPKTQTRGGIFDAFDLEPLKQVVRDAYPNDPVLQKAVADTEEEVEQGVEEVQEVISRFSRLATLGSLVDIILHEGRTSLTYIAFELRDLNAIAEGKAEGQLATRLSALHTRLVEQRDALVALFDRIEPLSGRRRGRPRQVSLHTVAGKAFKIVDHEIRESRASVSVTGDDQTVTVDEGDLISIIVNLVRNALYWTSTVQPPGERVIEVRTSRNADRNVVIEVLDNGPGVTEADKHAIFDAYYSTRPHGIGMGLSIAGAIVQDFYDGELVLISPGALGGATFRVILRKRVG